MSKCQNEKKDCFANCKEVGCIALADTTFINTDGTKRECPFYKPKEEVKEHDIQLREE